MLESSHALVVQWIEQSRPKGLMWVRFLPWALKGNAPKGVIFFWCPRESQLLGFRAGIE